MTRTRIIGILKIVLPLAALGLLSTLFLLSREIDPLAELPMTEADLETRAREQRVSEPYFAGRSGRGDHIALSAASARPGDRESQLALAEDLRARIELAEGTQLTFLATTGTYDGSANTAALTGGVQISTSTGYEITTPGIVTRLDRIDVTSGAIEGSGPLGTFTAGHMRLTATEGEDDTAHLVFTGGVKVIYTPEKVEK